MRTAVSLQVGQQAAQLLRATGLTPFQRHPTTGDAEVQLAHVMSSLQQPQFEAHRLRFLQQAAAARGIGHPRTAHLLAQNLQVLIGKATECNRERGTRIVRALPSYM